MRGDILLYWQLPSKIMPLLFTTSWDDGNVLDVRIAEMLERYDLRGTFYVLPHEGGESLRNETIRALAEKHEIGAHTLRHRNLPDLPREEMESEIRGSKEWVQHITGKSCTMFCYPRGFVSTAAKHAIAQAGFAGARTTVPLQFGTDDPYMLPTTLQVYPFPMRPRFSQWWHPLDPLGPLRAKWRRLRALGTPIAACKGWLPLAKWLLVYAVQTEQPFFHLWGHAKEIERYGMWEQLEALLVFAKTQDIAPATNAEFIAALRPPSAL